MNTRKNYKNFGANMICKKCGMEKKLMGFYNNYQDKLLPHILCKCPHYDTGEKL